MTVICILGHHADGFGDVPTGSLWDDGHPVVTASPEAFTPIGGVTEVVTEEPAKSRRPARPRTG